MSKVVIIAGGSGFIGKHLSDYLEGEGYVVKVLSRKAKDDSHIYWDGKSLGDWVSSLDGAHALINLSGRSLACRWTRKNWQEICDSRIESTLILGEALKLCRFPVRYWVNVSGIHYYADSTLAVGELGANGSTCLARFCREWENAMYGLEHLDTKKIVLRIGFLLGKDGGAFPFLRNVTRCFLGGHMGSGKQFISWVHLDDLMRQFMWLIERGEAGFYNGVSPYSVTNKCFMSVLRGVCRRPWSPPLPSLVAPFVLSLLGFEPSLILEGHNIVPKRFLNDGFKYVYDDLEIALRSVY